MSEVKLNLIDSQETLHGTIHGSVADACVAALSAEPETIAELASALARYIKPLDEVSPFASFRSTKISVPSEGVTQVEMSRGQEGGHAPAPLRTGSDKALGSQTSRPMSAERDHVSTAGASARVINLPCFDLEPWDAGIVVIDLAARLVAVESTYSLPQPEGEVHYHDGTSSTDIPVMYRLPDDWLFVNSVESYQWSRERRTAERLARTPLDVREVLYGIPLLDFILNEFKNIDLSEASAPAEHAAEDDGPKNGAAEDAIAGDAIENDAAVNDAAGEDVLATEISNIHARWLMTPREDLRGQSPRGVLLARHDFIDFDLHTRAMQWSLQNEGPPCLGKNSFAYRFAGFGTHEFVIYYDLVRHLICTLVESQLKTSPTSNVQSPTSREEGLIETGGESALAAATRVRASQGQEGGLPPQRGCPAGDPGLAPATVLRGSSPTIREGVAGQHSILEPAIQPGMSQGQEGGLAPALLSTSSTAQTLGPRAPSPAMSAEREHVSTTCGSGWVSPLIATLDQIKTTWLEQPQPEYGGRIPAILIDNERKRLPEAMRPRDMIIDDDCPMCQMFGDETTPLGMGVGFWHLDGCNMDDDFAFSSYRTRDEWEAENRRRDEFNAEFNRKWEERQQRIARGETLEFDPFFDPDPFPGFESDGSSMIFRGSTDDEEELAQ